MTFTDCCAVIGAGSVVRMDGVDIEMVKSDPFIAGMQSR